MSNLSATTEFISIIKALKSIFPNILQEHDMENFRNVKPKISYKLCTICLIILAFKVSSNQ